MSPTPVQIPFVFPGEGMVINGVHVTDETPLVPGQLKKLAGYPGSEFGYER